MAGLDDAGVNGAYGNFVHTVTGDTHEGVLIQGRFGTQGGWRFVHQGQVASRPGGMTQPRPLIRVRCPHTAQVSHCALHACGRGEDVGKARAGPRRVRQFQREQQHHRFGEQCGEHRDVARGICPQGEQASAARRHVRCAGAPRFQRHFQAAHAG